MTEGEEKAKGFTLIELVVAITILAVSAGVFLDVFSTGLSQSHKANLIGRATGVAESILEQVGRNIPLTNGETKGRTDGLIWQLSIRPFLDNTKDRKPVVTAHIVETSVFWGALEGEMVRLTTLRLKIIQ